MITPLNPNMALTTAPPVMEARRWLQDIPCPTGLPLLNFSQAAPMEAPAQPLLRALSEFVHQPQAHRYGPDLGLPDLRAEIAAQWSASYGGEIADTQVAVTSGCNQAFCAAIATLAAPGDNVILPSPWYFNHKMWLDISGLETRTLSCGPDMLPDPERAKSLIDAKTRAIVLVSPNNPVGIEYPPALIRAFADLARAHGLALIVDETYRDFRRADGPAHDLFTDPDWEDVLIHLYSFSKVFRLTGHRVGALIASAERLAEVEKFIDTTTICPNQIGQYAALYGLRHLSSWVAGQRAELLHRLDTVRAGFDALPDWRLRASGAYFAWVEHPFDLPAQDLAQAMLRDRGILALPGSMFMGQGDGHTALRLAFANADTAGLADFFARLENYSPS